jgi:hypothetical protein
VSHHYFAARSTVDYALAVVEQKCNHFSYEALNELLNWVVLPAGNEKQEPRMFGELLQRAEAAARHAEFWRGPYATPRFMHYRHISEEALAEFARLIRAEAFNEYRALNNQAVR